MLKLEWEKSKGHFMLTEIHVFLLTVWPAVCPVKFGIFDATSDLFHIYVK